MFPLAGNYEVAETCLHCVNEILCGCRTVTILFILFGLIDATTRKKNIVE